MKLLLLIGGLVVAGLLALGIYRALQLLDRKPPRKR
ncbi:hypothetical protein GGR16_002643 [Chelatococcus caeni]|uniref:Uncharacterized protein n=1 Tax=Chelatococcus caeni TaxID=1348468 RepID=A0A840C282_9HYPH|nr:hypothetical protein [Chelatococcus caeni]